MRSGQLDQARKLFVEAYEANPPIQVKATIARFIDQIDHIRGKFAFGISAAHLTNPLAQPSLFSFNWNGFALQSNVNPKQQNVWGAIYFGSYEKTFADGYDFRVSGLFRDMSSSFADMLNGEISAGKYFEQISLGLRVGAQALRLQGQSFNLPYVEADYRFLISERWVVLPQLQIGYFDSLVANGFSGANYRFTAPFVYTIDPANLISVGPKMEYRNANFVEQKYFTYGLNFQASINFDVIGANFIVFPKITEYQGVDPFWGVRRSDKGLYVSAEISSELFRYKGFIPSIGFYCDYERSDIQYYTQNDCGFLTNLRTVY
jgi:hypothetical protein